MYARYVCLLGLLGLLVFLSVHVSGDDDQEDDPVVRALIQAARTTTTPRPTAMKAFDRWDSLEFENMDLELTEWLRTLSMDSMQQQDEFDNTWAGFDGIEHVQIEPETTSTTESIDFEINFEVIADDDYTEYTELKLTNDSFFKWSNTAAAEWNEIELDLANFTAELRTAERSRANKPQLMLLLAVTCAALASAYGYTV